MNYMSSSDGLIAFERPSMAITTWASLLLVGLGVMFVTACAEPNPIAMTMTIDSHGVGDGGNDEN